MNASRLGPHSSDQEFMDEQRRAIAQMFASSEIPFWPELGELSRLIESTLILNANSAHVTGRLDSPLAFGLIANQADDGFLVGEIFEIPTQEAIHAWKSFFGTGVELTAGDEEHTIRLLRAGPFKVRLSFSHLIQKDTLDFLIRPNAPLDRGATLRLIELRELEKQTLRGKPCRPPRL